jgi:hypothetical protein
MMKRFLLTMFLMLFALFTIPCFSQEAPAQLGGGGVNWNQYNTPQISGNLFYAIKIAENGGFPTYNFNIVDVTSKTLKPFTINVSITPGIAQQVAKFNNWRYFVLGAIGPSMGGASSDPGGIVNLAWSTGGAVTIPYKKIVIIPMFRALKTSTQSDFQAVYGVNIGFIGK